MSNKVVGLIHNVPVSSDKAFSEASYDVLIQVEAIEKALMDLGHRPIRIPFTREISGFIRRMKESGIEIAVNLCETVEEDPCFTGHPAALLELLSIPFSGSSAIALMLTTDKIITKQL